MIISKRLTIPLTTMLFLICILLPLALNTSPPAPLIDAALLAEHNRGVALMGQYDFEAALPVFEKLAKRFPTNWEIRVNLAIATFNRQKKGDEMKALSILKEVLKHQPANLRALYCSGLLELYRGSPENAISLLKKVLKVEPDNAETIYFIGKSLMQLRRYQEALDNFRRTAVIDPYIRSAYYGELMALRQLGKAGEAAGVIAEFQRLKNNPRARIIEFKYTKMGRKADAVVIDSPSGTAYKKQLHKKPAGSLFNTRKAISLNNTLPWLKANQQNKDDKGASVSLCDINGDGRTDIFIPGAHQLPAGSGNALLLLKENGTYTADIHHPLAGITGVNAALWGDVNNDGLVDVYLCRNGKNYLYFAAANGKWENVTPETKCGGGDFDTVDGALYDADHDGDLDIFTVNANGPNQLHNNNRDGTFRPLAAEYGLKGSGTSQRILVTDLDADQDADIIIFNTSPPHEVYINQRLWKYTPAKGADAFINADITAAVAGDVDADGRTEIYTIDANETLSRFLPTPTGPWKHSTLTSNTPAPKTKKGRSYLALTDIDGNGKPDMIIAGKNGWRALSITGDTTEPLFTAPEKENTGFAACSVLNTLQGPSFLGWNPGKAPLIWTAGKGRYPFASFTLSGKEKPDSNWRTNASGIGCRLAIRVESRWTVLDTFRSNSGPGQGLQPVSAGLGGAKHIDFVSIDWTDGVFQTELNLSAGKKHLLVETQRQLSSCPVLFAWNGKKYEFVSDLLGVGGIGYAVAPGEYAEPRPWENFMFPRELPVPHTDRLKFKITEPMEEIIYLDTVGVKAYDLPPGWNMVLDERMGIMAPQPTGQPVFYRDMMLPSIAINDRNEDVTALVTKRDLKAAPVGPLDYRFIGMLERDHVLTLTFPRGIEHSKGRAVLMADGWVEYPYSQTNFAAWQAGAQYRAATIEIRTPAGQWETLLEQFGYPAGMPRRMSVPLPPLPKGTHQLRIITNQEIYWDRLAVVFSENCPNVESHSLELKEAIVEQTGYPHRPELPQRLPYYDYEKRTPTWDCRYLEGYYTRFGDVLELVSTKDNALAIFGAGEGLHLEFTTPPSAPQNGWTRRYVLESRGWCKDMDLYTGTGESVTPLPSTAPLSPHAKKLHHKYNTRYLSGRE
ncbi:MAG: tetratricopeptide repeat protein [bacterium]|nr:tetratricopeptide repeat protein [bacterium]